jgi:serine protease Do
MQTLLRLRGNPDRQRSMPIYPRGKPLAKVLLDFLLMKKVPNSILSRAFWGALALLCALTQGTVAQQSSNPPPRLNIQEGPLNRDLKARTSFAPVIKKVGPSVVNIYSTLTLRDRSMERSMGNPLFDDPAFRHFFGDPFGGRSQPRERKAQSLGSGVIVSADGYILTASHVVDGADKVKVALASGEKEFDAKIIGADPPSDIALLKIEGKDLPQATIADSDKLEVGDLVLAIGNPFAVGQTVTMGIVSAVGRGGFGINTYENFIQTDAAINPGNSGGALVDAEGRLIGINTAIFSRSGGNMGVGFAVPINMARYVMDRLTSEGKVNRGYLGVYLQPEITPRLMKEFRLQEMSGALVTKVEPGSPAAKAGLKEGDFIVDFNGKKVSDMRQLQILISQSAPGTKATLKLYRDGKEKTVSTTLGQLPDALTARGGRNQPGERGQSGTDALDGVEVTDLDVETRRELSIPNSVRGVLVTDVEENSNAAEAGLRPRDVIIEINRRPVHNAEEAITLSEKAESDSILLRIWRGVGGQGGNFYLSVDNTKRK